MASLFGAIGAKLFGPSEAQLACKRLHDAWGDISALDKEISSSPVEQCTISPEQQAKINNLFDSVARKLASFYIAGTDKNKQQYRDVVAKCFLMSDQLNSLAEKVSARVRAATNPDQPMEMVPLFQAVLKLRELKNSLKVVAISAQSKMDQAKKKQESPHETVSTVETLLAEAFNLMRSNEITSAIQAQIINKFREASDKMRLLNDFSGSIEELTLIGKGLDSIQITLKDELKSLEEAGVLNSNPERSDGGHGGNPFFDVCAAHCKTMLQRGQEIRQILRREKYKMQKNEVATAVVEGYQGDSTKPLRRLANLKICNWLERLTKIRNSQPDDQTVETALQEMNERPCRPSWDDHLKNIRRKESKGVLLEYYNNEVKEQTKRDLNGQSVIEVVTPTSKQAFALGSEDNLFTTLEAEFGRLGWSDADRIAVMDMLQQGGSVDARHTSQLMAPEFSKKFGEDTDLLFERHSQEYRRVGLNEEPDKNNYQLYMPKEVDTPTRKYTIHFDANGVVTLTFTPYRWMLDTGSMAAQFNKSGFENARLQGMTFETHLSYRFRREEDANGEVQFKQSRDLRTEIVTLPEALKTAELPACNDGGGVNPIPVPGGDDEEKE